MRPYQAMRLSSKDAKRRCTMAMTVQPRHPVAHVPLGLGILRRLEVAPLLAGSIPPHPGPGLSCGRGVEALVLAMLDGHHALDTVGKRLEERGMGTLRQAGLTPRVPPAMLPAWGPSSMPCVQPISTRS